MPQQNQQQTQNNVIGPILQDDWKALRSAREDLRIMKKLNPFENGVYDEAIGKEQRFYEEKIQSYLAA